MNTIRIQIGKYRKNMHLSLKSILELKYILILILITALMSSCSKEEVVTENEDIIDDKIENLFGEKTFHVGSYDTYPVKIETAVNNNEFVILGTAREQEDGEYPFLAILNDSLVSRKLLYPAYSEIYTSAQGLAKLSDGYVILSSNGSTQLQGNDGIRLTKVSFEGEKIWEKEYFSGVLSVGPNITTDNDNCIMVALEQAFPFDVPFYSRLARFDSDGNLLWDFDMYHGLLNQPKSVVTNKLNEYIVIIDSITDCHTCMQDRVVIPIVHKIDKEGNILWKKRLESNNGRGWKAIADIDNNNDIIIAHEPGSLEGSIYHNKLIITKLDSSGNTIWSTSIKKEMFKGRTDYSTGFAEVHEIEIGHDNNIYVIGYINEQIFFGPHRLAIAKLNTNGEVIKTKIYNEESQYWGMSIKSLSDDKLIVLAKKFWPYEIAVFYIDSELEIR